MLRQFFFLFFLLAVALPAAAQQDRDSTVKVDANYITLSEIVVNRQLDVAAFIRRIKTDTTFYKAFRNLRVIGYQSVNDIRMLDKDGKVKASLHSTTRQIHAHGCRTMKVLDQKSTGDFFDRHGNFNYYTAQMYAGLFFTRDTVCGETNVVRGHEFSTSGRSGIDKHKEQLKMLFFNPGRKIPGLPFISNNTALFDPQMAADYNMHIDYRDYNSVPCYVFTVVAKDNHRGDVVIDEMTTWFDAKTFDILGRNYELSYDAGVFDFKVRMEVRMTRVGDLLVPAVLDYNGNWKVVFNKRERGAFTATLSDFTVN